MKQILLRLQNLPGGFHGRVPPTVTRQGLRKLGNTLDAGIFSCGFDGFCGLQFCYFCGLVDACCGGVSILFCEDSLLVKFVKTQ